MCVTYLIYDYVSILHFHGIIFSGQWAKLNLQTYFKQHVFEDYPSYLLIFF